VLPAGVTVVEEVTPAQNQAWMFASQFDDVIPFRCATCSHQGRRRTMKDPSRCHECVYGVPASAPLAT
jgi:predicted Zn-ribbon and HTH transcriptional regulator